jgi:ATP phosphoribosyltransferase regulatory subunit HisZ
VTPAFLPVLAQTRMSVPPKHEKVCPADAEVLQLAMSLATVLKELGVKASAEEVYAVIHQTLKAPVVSVSDLTEAIAARIYGGTSKVITDSSNEIWAAASSRIVRTLVEEGELAIEGRLIRGTEKLGGTANAGGHRPSSLQR